MTPKQVKPLSILPLICALLLAACDQLPDFSRQPHMAYHFDAPATEWPECLPLGNGRIGLTPDGGIVGEKRAQSAKSELQSMIAMAECVCML